MTVRLVTGHHPAAEGWDSWAAIAAAPHWADPARRRAGTAAALETAFDMAADEWLDLARKLGAEPSAVLAHAPSAATNASDMGLMLAWTRLVDQWAAEPEITLVICDDPWLFRHLAARPGVLAATPPGFARRMLKMALRGMVARAVFALRACRAALALRRQRRAVVAGAPVILAYGHPASTADGLDGYFGPMLRLVPELVRVLHADCRPARACELAADGRSASLHGWGSPLFALACLPFARWRPRPTANWLVRRAAALEGATAQAAALAWQLHCQRRFLAQAKPRMVAWPWENHGWERDFVRAARALGVATIGYQHSVVGRQMLNYSPGSNPDGAASLPDRILCSGQTTLEQLSHWGIQPARLAVGGALRFAISQPVPFDAEAPVFIALPFDRQIAAEMVEAAHQVATRTGRRFVVKEHPMNPTEVREGPGVTRTHEKLEAQPALAAVLWAATSVGLEAVLMGLPSLRFRPSIGLAIDILPPGLMAIPVDFASLGNALSALTPPPPPARDPVFAPVDLDLWYGIFRISTHDQAKTQA